MLIVALVLAVIGLAALVTAVVSSNEIVAWVCIGASALGVILLVVDAVRERQRRASGGLAAGVVAADAEGTDVDLTDTDFTDTDVTEFDDLPGDDEVTAVVGPISEQEAEIEGEIDAGIDIDVEPLGANDTGDTGGVEASPELLAEEHPEAVVREEPEFDTYGDDEPEYPAAAEESAVHIVGESESDSAEPEGR